MTLENVGKCIDFSFSIVSMNSAEIMNVQKPNAESKCPCSINVRQIELLSNKIFNELHKFFLKSTVSSIETQRTH